MSRIGYQNGVEAAKARMRKLDPGGFKADGTGAWDKFFRSIAHLVSDHDAGFPVTPPPPPPDPTPTFKRVAPRVAFAAGGSDARFCLANQPGVRRIGDNHWVDDVATYDDNGLCKDGRRSGAPALTSALNMDGRAPCELPTTGDAFKNTGSWAI
jgi:hypothetical protein